MQRQETQGQVGTRVGGHKVRRAQEWEGARIGGHKGRRHKGWWAQGCKCRRM